MLPKSQESVKSYFETGVYEWPDETVRYGRLYIAYVIDGSTANGLFPRRLYLPGRHR